MIPSPTTSRPAGLPAWLRALVVALLVALAVPAIAMADEGAAGGAATAEQPTATEQPATTDETAAQPAPADQAPPAAEAPAPATTEAGPPVAEGPAPTPQAPPASSGGGPVTDTPLPAIDLPEIRLPVPTIPEVLPGEPPLPGAAAAPTPGVGELVPVLTAPEAPRPPSIGTIAPALPPKAVSPAAVPATTTVSAQAADVVTPLDLGGPPSLSGAGQVSATSRAAATGREALAAASASLHGSLITLDPSHRPDPSGPAAGRDPVQGTAVFGAEDPTAQIAAPQLVSPVGPAPAQSLLAVLASYILPGSGPVPAGTIFLLVMLGVVLLAAFAPRPGGSERIWLSGLVGPGSGHGLAVRRPG